MTSLSSLVTSFIVTLPQNIDSSNLPIQIASGLSNKLWSLRQIVLQLSSVLVDEDDNTRSRGVQLLAQIVKVADNNILDRQSTKTLTTFFTDKLADPPSLIPCTAGLSALTQSSSFGVGEGIEVIRGIFASVKLASFPQSTRFHVYSLIDALISRCRPACKRLGIEFIKGYCELVDGEKDPRNLLISFSMIRVILVEFDITNCVDELFDVTFCYFPITFTPPADDPYGITSEDLVIALRNCLCATPRFGKLALPLFLDKMQAASEKAKRQTIEALAVCFPIYGAAVSGEWAGRFSEGFSIEIFHASDEATADLAVVAFQSLFATLYPDPSALTRVGGDPSITTVEEGDENVESVEDITTEAVTITELPLGVEGVGVKVINNSLEELKEPDKSNAIPAIRILAALMLASNRLAVYIISKTLPHLLTMYKDPDEVSLRAPLLTCLSALIAGFAPSKSTPTGSSVTFDPPPISHADGSSPLESYRDELLSIFTSGSRSAFSRPPALAGLVHLVEIPGFLSSSEVTFCGSALNDVLSAAESESDYDLSLSGLIKVAKLYPRIVETSTLPILFALLPSSAPSSSSSESEIYRRSLTSLASLSLHPDLFEILSLRLLARLEGVCASSFPDPLEQSNNSLYAHHLLATLRAVLAQKAEKGHEDIQKYVEKLVPRLFAIFVLPTVTSMDKGEVAKDARLLADVGEVVASIIQKVDVARQTTLSVALSSALYDGNLVPLLDEQAKDASIDLPFQPLASESSIEQQDTIILFASALLAMRPTITVTSGDLTRFLRTFLDRSLVATNQVQTTAVLHILGSTINKRAPDAGDFLDKDMKMFWSDKIIDPMVNVVTRKAALRTWSWIAKGLIARSDPRGYDSVTDILGFLHDPQLGREAAIALGSIADDSDRVLSKENFAVLRMLYKQKFFAFLLPKIVQGYKSAIGDDQAVYLVALSCLLQHIPRQMALTELPKLLPLLITALDLPDPALRANVIETLAVLVKEVASEIEGSVTGIVTKIVKGLSSLVNSTTKGSVKLRLASLEFLAILPSHIGYSILHPQKPMVLQELGKAVDDGKKVVRRAAVEARSKWFLYG